MTSQTIQKLKLKTCIATLFIIVLLLQLSNNGTLNTKAENEQIPGIRLASTVGIVINDANISYYSSSGAGLIDNPYIIDNLIIDTNQSLAVEFKSVTSYFVLRDSYLKGATYGVYMSSVALGRSKVINCTIEGGLSIGGINSHYMTVHNCTLRALQGSSFSRGLNFTKNVVEIMGLYSSSLMHIAGENNIVDDNVIYGDSSAIRINDILNSSIRNNILDRTGFYIYEDKVMNILNNTYENNIINGKPFGFFYNRSDEIITGNQYGQIYIVNSINIDIEGYEMNNVNMGLQVHNCTDISIRNVNGSGKNGIEARTVEGLLIENCNWNGDDDGTQLWVVNDAIIQNNYIANCRYAIKCDFVDNIQIHNNTIFNATEEGLSCEYVYNLIATFNIISCFVETEGSQLAVSFWDCENATLYYNIFISLGNLMAYPVEEWSVTNIIWYNDVLEIGNYYSDWNGLGTYSLTGDGGSVDLYPFIDIDEDDLTEYEEVIGYFTNPFNADSDSDGMDDLWEVTYGTNPTTDDADEDPDDDGLTNIEEYNHNTLPTNNDTDSDGYLDGEEVEAGTDPLNSSDYPIVADGPNLGLIIGIAGGAGVAGAVTAYIIIRKRKSKKITKKKKK